jgi:hypothetical protein
MPQSGTRWRHVTLGTHNSWLPGDPRGFRSYRHKVHSGGDYKNPPPPGEHAGLYAFSQSISGQPVVIPEEYRSVVGKKILKKLKEAGYQTLAIAVAGMHVHIQVELPDNLAMIRQIMGNCKRAASHAIRDVLPGQVWARDGGYKPINDKQHHGNVFHYILGQEDAWIWSFKDGFPDDL